MAFTQTDADNLRRAIARGIRSATINGESVTYASLAEMRTALNMIEAELNGTAADAGSFKVVYPRTGRGLS